MWCVNSAASKSQKQSMSNKNEKILTEEDSDKNQNTSQDTCDLELQRPVSFLEARMRRAADLHSKFLSTGCERLDKFLCGGIPCFGITEVYGESASAKTQICLQLALLAQRNTATPSVIYINTESSFPVKRLAELAEYFSTNEETPMNNIIVETVLDSDSLFRCLHVRLPNLINVRKSNIRLIVIDSLAAIFRAEYDRSESVERAQELRKIGVALHQLGQNLEAPIVVVNQATSSMSSSRSVPSLGLAWTNMVTTRLHLFRQPPDRFIEIVHACHIPPGNLKIFLSKQGISGFV